LAERRIRLAEAANSIGRSREFDWQERRGLSLPSEIRWG
jgi:hypothetical protein